MANKHAYVLQVRNGDHFAGRAAATPAKDAALSASPRNVSIRSRICNKLPGDAATSERVTAYQAVAREGLSPSFSVIFRASLGWPRLAISVAISERTASSSGPCRPDCATYDGEGLLRTGGALAGDEEWAHVMTEIHQTRKLERRDQTAEAEDSQSRIRARRETWVL
ncbi:MAG: hypothetical protein FJ291_08490 [Planctomycetes bacterium]|nr:hypothetical protein [Planctomycetota bacterium]